MKNIGRIQKQLISDDMQQMLEDGEIDMVTSARKTPDREEKFDFSRPIGTNHGMLTVRSDNSTIVDGNYSTYNGMRVALLNGNTRNEEFADFADNKGFTYVPSYFDTTAEMEEALQSEKVDAIVTSSLRKTNNERIVDKFGSSDFYVIVKKGNTELLNEINYAIDQMNAVEGDWKTTLYNKNYVATFLNATQNAPIRDPYLDLDRILQGKDFHILTTNQDTQFVKIYPEEKVSEIQGDHRFFQCSQCCQDETWDAVQPVADMIAAMGEGTMVPDELIPRCPHCGAEMFPWVRGYGNFLQGKKYEEEYEKISKYIQKNKDRKILFIELGVGRMTPMFIQEPFWELTNSLKDAYYISVNSEYQFLPEFIEDKGIAILGDIGTVLKDLRKAKEESAFV